jgi:hypothetical protein
LLLVVEAATKLPLVKKSRPFRVHGYAITCLSSGTAKTVVQSLTIVCTPHLV